MKRTRAVISICCALNLSAMYIELPTGGSMSDDEVRLMARMVLASCCIKGYCVCPHERESCKYLVACNNYLVKKARERKERNPWRYGNGYHSE